MAEINRDISPQEGQDFFGAPAQWLSKWLLWRHGVRLDFRIKSPIDLHPPTIKYFKNLKANCEDHIWAGQLPSLAEGGNSVGLLSVLRAVQ